MSSPTGRIPTTTRREKSMTQDELFDKLIKQYQAGLITMDEFHSEVIEANLIHKLGINEGIAR